MIYAIGPLLYRVNSLAKAGDKVDGHEHHFDHNTRCKRGRMRVTRVFLVRDGEHFKEVTKTSILTPDDRDLLIEKGVRHELVAEVDNTQYECIYPHREFDGTIVEHYTGWQDAYE